MAPLSGALRSVGLLAYGIRTATGDVCVATQDFTFPEPSVAANRVPLTQEQEWMQQNWPGYHNGVSLGGSFVIEDWMFYRNSGEPALGTLQLPKDTQFDQLAWCQALRQGDLETAYATVDCHLRSFYDDEALDLLAAHGYNAVRLAVGYWLFDDLTLYPQDPWIQAPSGSGRYGDYGVNPDGYITPGTRAVSDFVIRLWNRNMRVVLDMHALPGCSSPHQSYAGVRCEAQAPNTWNGEAHDGISGGHAVQRADDGKSWRDVAWKIALERVVPWIKFINARAPGAVIGYELINEPDIAANDASVEEVRSLTVDLGEAVLNCLGSSANDVFVGISTAAQTYSPSLVAQDYLSGYSSYEGNYVSDIHHYFFWAGCIEGPSFSVQCACEANLPGTAYEGADADWSGWMKAGVFQGGWRFFVGEWSAGLGTAQACQNGLPTMDQAQKLWMAQKWGYLNQYLHYRGDAAGGRESSFLGDFFWNGRMGHKWNPDPQVCAGGLSVDDYQDFKFWDWSLLLLIKLGIARPLSQLGWTPATIGDKKGEACTGSIPVQCSQTQGPQAPPGGQPGMQRLDATLPGPPLSDVPIKRSSGARLAQAAAAAAVAAGVAGAAVAMRRQWPLGRARPTTAAASQPAHVRSRAEGPDEYTQLAAAEASLAA